MSRLTWLADELREAGLRVVEVDGWKTRGSSDFDPIGVTWHATAGSRTSTAKAEVNVILNGSTTAPPPIAQIMAYRDGTLYLCAAGRCNHNKVGWDGPNKGLGNTRLLGIEMANDNRGEPWPDAQLDAVRRATAVIMRRLGADPMRRLAAHYEHQPYATRPPGEGSTKSDPYGVVMSKERPRVAAIMRGDDVALDQDDIEKIAKRSAQVVWDTVMGTESTARRFPEQNQPAGNYLMLAAIFGKDAATAAAAEQLRDLALKQGVDALAARDFVDEPAIVAGVLAGLPASAIAAAIPADMANQVVDELLARLSSVAGGRE